MAMKLPAKSILAALTLGLAASSALQAASLEEIRERGVLNAATSGNLPPVSYVNEKNELVGYDINVARYIEDKIGVKIEINRLDWKGILPGLQTGRFDAVFSNVNITPERKDTFTYSIPYSRAAVVVVRLAEAEDITSYKTLEGKRVGGISGGNDGEIPAREISEKFGAFEQFKGYAGYAEMLQDLMIGRVDALIMPDTAAGGFLKSRPGVAKIVGEPYMVRYVGVPMQKGSNALKAEIDAAIREMREEGLLDEWGLEHFGIENFSDQLVDEVP
ncbi:substrate-binding periplasmic protein [Oceanibium sediminis]|uniref:substrate-binding periplasmic protein n=1 Tax=Oceanibium sediminis TaxID=2026339 RepID=UPI000DD36E7D|nr:transporter substrate-binding domain-containing protein [Oceanibium sediminis]